MFTPNSGDRLLKAFLVAVLLGLCFAKIHAAETKPTKPSTQAVIYTPTICDVVEPYGFWYYAFYCDERGK